MNRMKLEKLSGRPLSYALWTLIVGLILAPMLGGAYIYWRIASSPIALGCFAIAPDDPRVNKSQLISERSESARFGRAPQWTPDGDYIVFAETDYPESLYAARVNGAEAELSPLGARTHDRHYALSPAVSPDGSLIAYSDGRIQLISLDGTERRPPYFISGERSVETSPVWSPDNSRIAFVSYDDCSTPWPEGIYTMKPDGTDLRLIVNLRDGLLNGVQLSDVSAPSWSFKGDYISFVGFVHRADSGAMESALYMADSDGSNLSKPFAPPLESGTLIASHPTWSPDGRFVAVLEVASRNLRIRRIDVDGGNRHIVTDTGLDVESDGFAPMKLSYSPDGSRMAFMFDGDLYAVDENGLDPRLAFAGADDATSEPAWSWSPDGSTLTLLSKSRIISLDDGNADDTSIIIYAISPENPDEPAVILRARKSAHRNFFKTTTGDSTQNRRRADN